MVSRVFFYVRIFITVEINLERQFNFIFLFFFTFLTEKQKCFTVEYMKPLAEEQAIIVVL